VPGIDPKERTPREMRHTFVSLLSDSGLHVDQIALLVGHAGGSQVTERIYRKQLRPVIQTGATAMDTLFPGRASAGWRRCVDTQLVTRVGFVARGKRKPPL
jgi:site-specific recombinase XerD